MLEHRGPDDKGFFVEGPVGLLHRRLSIIDIIGGSQPMFNEEKTLVLVYNGEIYNFVELRSDLESKGHVFTTSSDTEVILHSFEEWGKECVVRFQGMFAFALYNRKDSSLFLARDRCGEKPIYFFYEDGKFIFASEVQVLLALLEQAPTPNPVSIYLYLRLGYIPAPYSFFSKIKKIKVGSCITFKDGDISCWTYYKPCQKNDNRVNVEDLYDELDARLRRAVKKMLISDVPLGAFLSGGLDSSLIVAMMARQSASPETFSISFGHTSFDESQPAHRSSRIIGTRHTEYQVNFGNFDECLVIMDDFGEPFADSSGIATYYLARETRKKTKVALSGDGSDELFGGYRRYVAQRFSKYYKLLPSFLRKGLIDKILLRLPDKDVYYADSFIKSTRIFLERTEISGLSAGLMISSVFSHDEITSLFPDLPDGRLSLQDAIGTLLPSNSVEALMYVDRQLYLPDDILVKVDRMSMRNSLEVRSPYLDPEVLELADQIPLSMKIKGLNQKYLLKKVALRYLPPNIVFRKKQGFMVPLVQWIKKAGREDIKSRMPPQANSKAVDQLLCSHFESCIDNSHKLFALIILGRYVF